MFFILIHPVATWANDTQPNILLIHMEDMGCQIPAYGDNTVATPNLDKLAAEGLVFERAHVTAATCASSRGSLFSGLYPHQNGIVGFVSEHGFHFRDNIPTFIRDLKAAGYVTGLTYKTGVESIHYQRNPVPFDFAPRYTENYLTGQTRKDAPAAKTPEANLASFSVDNFRYFLENRVQGKPFYFQAQTPDTHTPWNYPNFVRKGDPGWPDAYPEVNPAQVTKIPGWGDALPARDGLARTVAQYYRAIQRTDWFVGRILSLLDEKGLRDNTLVIFSSDHGPSHLLRGKTTPYESGLRVPFIVRWPGEVKQPGSRSQSLVSFVDLYPTFVDAAGLDIPDHLPGHSLLPVLRGGESPRRYLYSAYVAHTTGMHLYWPTRTITDGRWKLIHHLFGDGKRHRYPEPEKSAFPILLTTLEAMPADSPARQVARRSSVPPAFELYDLKNDPHELQNLFGGKNGGQREIETRLKQQLKHWQQNLVLDPFAQPEYVHEFSAHYRKNFDLWKSLGGYSMKDPRALDFETYIPAWDATPYIGKKD